MNIAIIILMNENIIFTGITGRLIVGSARVGRRVSAARGEGPASGLFTAINIVNKNDPINLFSYPRYGE